jgi:uracil-DNA glycosylase
MTSPPLPPPGTPPEIPSSPTLDALHTVMVRCTRCDLFLERTRVVPGAGSPRAGLFLVGEAPGAQEDRVGVPFVGASGRLLDRMLEEAGLRRGDVFIANVVRCRPPGNRNPKAREIRACAGWMAEQLRLVRPRLVAPLGRFALQHFVPAGKITELRGAVHEVPYGPASVRLFPLLHPAAVLRNPTLAESYRADFARLAAVLPTIP